MLKPLLIGSCLALGAALLGGCATHAGANPDQLASATAKNTSPDCIRETGTRINGRDGRCLNVPGSSYTQDDLDRTGEIDTGAALRKLDPRFYP